MSVCWIWPVVWPSPLMKLPSYAPEKTRHSGGLLGKVKPSPGRTEVLSRDRPPWPESKRCCAVDGATPLSDCGSCATFQLIHISQNAPFPLCARKTQSLGGRNSGLLGTASPFSAIVSFTCQMQTKTRAAGTFFCHCSHESYKPLNHLGTLSWIHLFVSNTLKYMF